MPHLIISNKGKNLIRLALIFTFALTIHFFSLKQTPQLTESFSAASLTTLKNLNQEYGIMVTDELLSTEKRKTTIISQLFQADIMVPVKKNPHHGLIAMVGAPQKLQGILLLQPETTLSRAELSNLANLYQKKIPELSSVEIDQDIELSSMSELKKFNNNSREILPRMIEKTPSQNSVKIAIVDSGLQISHPDFQNTSIYINDFANVIEDSADITDEVGHGTHIAGIISQNDPAAELFPYKIVSQNTGRLSHIIKALNLAINDQVDIINMSLGVLSYSPALESIVEKADRQGIIILAAAGNFNNEKPFYPGFFEETIAIGSVDEHGNKMPKSNYGEWVDLVAPGNRIRSAVPMNSYGLKSGTSQATAYVSGQIGKMLENGMHAKKEILEKLKDDYDPAEDPFEKVPFVK